MTPDGKYIIAVDFDGTLITGNTWPDVAGMPNLALINHLINERRRGNKIILYTCRTDEHLKVAVDYCKAAGLEFDAVNENLPEMIEAYGNDSRKVSADYYIDDRSYHPKDEDWEYLHLHKRDLERKE